MLADCEKTADLPAITRFLTGVFRPALPRYMILKDLVRLGVLNPSGSWQKPIFVAEFGDLEGK